MTVADALARVALYRDLAVKAEGNRRAVMEARATAMRDAHKAGASIPEIAKAAGVTHVPVYRALRAISTGKDVA